MLHRLLNLLQRLPLEVVLVVNSQATGSAFGSSAFGSQPATTTAFGTTTQPTATGSFGTGFQSTQPPTQPSALQPPLLNSAFGFGKPPTTSIFGRLAQVLNNLALPQPVPLVNSNNNNQLLPPLVNLLSPQLVLLDNHRLHPLSPLHNLLLPLPSAPAAPLVSLDSKHNLLQPLLPLPLQLLLSAAVPQPTPSTATAPTFTFKATPLFPAATTTYSTSH